MFRTIVEQTSRFSAIAPLSPALRAILRGVAILVAAVMALMFGPDSTRANLALCLASQSESHSKSGKIDSHSTQSAQSLAIERCLD
ncbi:hypothetical protein M3A49_08190 [Paraburkholderia sp. CNPSo 3076]|uniref:hypothetical protein n=1 Tax=Paraburkholderia sp. CNPSo 3076 TaxID=2940936 RepID=UPI002256FD77|nr:hypothetical protein [Paraburkholderia sp. CNPSo 3076]MCX5539470.1 hypothetical protein [Paraburkholderia sp. CNPSo 3076]